MRVTCVLVIMAFVGQLYAHPVVLSQEGSGIASSGDLTNSAVISNDVDDSPAEVAYQAAMLAAKNAYDTAVNAANAAYDVSVTAAGPPVADDGSPAGNAYKAAIDAAVLVRTASLNAAKTAYDIAVAVAVANKKAADAAAIIA
uniref:Pupal cuticle protein C1B-like n=1 Tax=Rhabditophanes sp. KR3021 TaxID=114890 RepID=A0AC35U2N5_9BILA